MSGNRIRYARSGDVSIAYQIVGDGPRDLVIVPGWVSNLEAAWEDPGMARVFDRLASFSRLILFDKRGTGLSDRVPTDQLPCLETRMDDVRAVMDAAGSERAALFGASEGGSMCILFAATYPERTAALIGFGVFAAWRVVVGAVGLMARHDRTRLGGGRRRRFGSEQGGGRAVPGVVRQLPAPQRQPRSRRGAGADEHRHRRSGGAVFHPGPHADHPSDRGPRRQHR